MIMIMIIMIMIMIMIMMIIIVIIMIVIMIIMLIIWWIGPRLGRDSAVLREPRSSSARAPLAGCGLGFEPSGCIGQ